MEEKNERKISTAVCRLHMLEEELALYPGATDGDRNEGVAELLSKVVWRAAYVIVGNLADIAAAMADETNDEDWREEAESYAKEYQGMDVTVVPEVDKG